MTIQEIYREISEDYSSVAKRLPGEKLIITVVRMFRDKNDFDSMIEAFQKRDGKLLFETSHNMKGASANLGFSKLCQACSEICEIARRGENISSAEPFVEMAKKEYESIIMAISQLD